MAEDGKVQIEKFDGKKFGWWKMQIEALLCQKDLDVVLEDERPEKMPQADWDRMDKKARAVITFSLSENVAFNIQKETSARGMMVALSNMYEKPSAANKVYLIRELVNTRMREGDLVTAHISNLNSILSRLVSVNIKFDDEVQALLLLSSLPDSWSGTVTAVTSSSDTSKFTFVKMRDLILGEDVRRRNSGGSSGDLMHVGGGRKNNRCSGSKNRKRSQSRARNDVTCWNCKEVGHFRNQCPNEKKEVNAAVDHSDDEVLICNVESSVDSWVMDSGASFHATHSSEALRNLKIGDFGKVRLANDEVLDVTGMGDIDLVNSVGSTWTLRDVRVIPGLKKMLISVGQLDDQGHEVKFGSGQWKVTKGNLVVARGKKRGSLYMVSVPPEGEVLPVQKKTKIRFTESRGQKKVCFADGKPRVTGQIQVERARKGSAKPVRGIHGSGSTGRASVRVTR
ncbi:putative RNA-directed DNA polymerase [Helianthus debilis subsp. tardiflorus]